MYQFLQSDSQSRQFLCFKLAEIVQTESGSARVEIGESIGMGGVENDIGRVSLEERLSPTKHAKTPSIAGLQTWEATSRCRQIVAFGFRVVQKVLIDFGAHQMSARIGFDECAIALAIVACHWIRAAYFQFGADHVEVGGCFA